MGEIAQPDSGWKDPVRFAGWMLVLAGSFSIILGCSSLIGHQCTLNTISFSLTIIASGTILLATQWVLWGEEDKPAKSTRKSRLKKLLIYALLLPVAALGLGILIALGGP